MPISDYLRGLRQKVGHELLLMPAVTVVCRDDQERVLLARHCDDDRWALPGGSIDPGETPADAAVREVWEETGLWVEPTRVVGVYGGPAFCVTYPNGDQIASVDTLFDVRVVGGKPVADGEEIHELRYFSQTELANLVLPPWMEVIRADLFDDDSRTHFQRPTWTPPADGRRKGGASGYVRNLRRRIGHDLLLMPSVFALVLDRQGNVLLQQRADNRRWSAPGGGMDPYESPSDAVVREVWEETGILVEPMRVLGVYGGSKLRHTHANGDQTASILIIFECQALEENPVPDGIESLDARFFPAAEAIPLLSRRWQEQMGYVLERQSSTHFEAATWRQPPMRIVGGHPADQIL